MGPIINKEVAECVGLWLAEGSTNSKSEITFTNDCLELIDLFYSTTKKLFGNFNERIYVYTNDGSRYDLPYKCNIKYYTDKRATKPYFIFRIASVVMIKEWNELVRQALDKKELYSYILRGFFAGEGNIHSGKRGIRVIRISQKKRKKFIEDLLDYFGLKYSFTSSNRNYVITNKNNWDIFARHKLADLHPQKREKFWLLYGGFKEEHYEKNYLRNKILELLNEQKTARELAKILNRSQSRISEVLVLLKKEGQTKNYRVKSVDYWTKNSNLIIISSVKDKYLNLLTKEKTTAELANNMDVDWKSSFKRLRELERLNLIELDENKKWKKIPTEKKIWVI